MMCKYNQCKILLSKCKDKVIRFVTTFLPVNLVQYFNSKDPWIIDQTSTMSLVLVFSWLEKGLAKNVQSLFLHFLILRKLTGFCSEDTWYSFSHSNQWYCVLLKDKSCAFFIGIIVVVMKHIWSCHLKLCLYLLSNDFFFPFFYV